MERHPAMAAVGASAVLVALAYGIFVKYSEKSSISREKTTFIPTQVAPPMSNEACSFPELHSIVSVLVKQGKLEQALKLLTQQGKNRFTKDTSKILFLKLLISHIQKNLKHRLYVPSNFLREQKHDEYSIVSQLRSRTETSSLLLNTLNNRIVKGRVSVSYNDVHLSPSCSPGSDTGLDEEPNHGEIDEFAGWLATLVLITLSTAPSLLLLDDVWDITTKMMQQAARHKCIEVSFSQIRTTLLMVLVFEAFRSSNEKLEHFLKQLDSSVSLIRMCNDSLDTEARENLLDEFAELMRCIIEPGT